MGATVRDRLSTARGMEGEEVKVGRWALPTLLSPIVGSGKHRASLIGYGAQRARLEGRYDGKG